MTSFNPVGFAGRTNRFADRTAAGRQLARELMAYKDRPDVLVLALPRGGVPVAYEVARELRAPLDVFVVRKLGVPGFPELAMGAIATGSVMVLNEDVVRETGVTPEDVAEVAAIEQLELERRELAYRGHARPLGLRGRTVILVDDGLATGATMRAAVQAARRLHALRVVVAVPVAPPSTCRQLEREADAVVYLLLPERFRAIGEWYDDFSQVTDDEVRDLLTRSVVEPAEEPAPAPLPP